MRVLPDGCVDLVWTGHQLIVAGPSTGAFGETGAGGETRLGLRFRVGAAGSAMGMPAGALCDLSPHLRESGVPRRARGANEVAHAPVLDESDIRLTARHPSAGRGPSG